VLQVLYRPHPQGYHGVIWYVIYLNCKRIANSTTKKGPSGGLGPSAMGKRNEKRYDCDYTAGGTGGVGTGGVTEIALDFVTRAFDAA
jgi:hypothetical protein